MTRNNLCVYPPPDGTNNAKNCGWCYRSAQGCNASLAPQVKVLTAQVETLVLGMADMGLKINELQQDLNKWKKAYGVLEKKSSGEEDSESRKRGLSDTSKMMETREAKRR